MFEIRCYDKDAKTSHTYKTGNDKAALLTKCVQLNERRGEGGHLFFLLDGTAILYPEIRAEPSEASGESTWQGPWLSLSPAEAAQLRQVVQPETAEHKVSAALNLLMQFGQPEGQHHLKWVLDQVVRTLTGPEYAQWVAQYRQGDEYDWDEGIAP